MDIIGKQGIKNEWRLQGVKMNKKLHSPSFRDPLTGLYNRLYLEETLEREISRCERKSSTLAMTILDIDHFKQFNDKFGHTAGDIILQTLAHALRDFARKEDIACRYSGEKFILIMPDIDMGTALERTEALHEKVSYIHLKEGGNPLTQITVSIGLALYPLHGENMQDLIASSDKALREAKQSGRNKTVLAV